MSPVQSDSKVIPAIMGEGRKFKRDELMHKKGLC
jgi:hypothetical protein